MSKQTIWIIEDHEAFRTQLQRALQLAFQEAEVYAFGSWDETLKRLKQSPPDIALVDIGLPGMDGIEGIYQLKSVSPSSQALVLTVFHDEDKILRAVCAGAGGYVLKSASLNDLVLAVRELAAGGTPMSKEVSRSIMEMLSRTTPPAQSTPGSLTERERAVIRLMADGFGKKEIADRLTLNQHTADYLMRAIYRKLGVNSAAAAVRAAIRSGLIQA